MFKISGNLYGIPYLKLSVSTGRASLEIIHAFIALTVATFFVKPIEIIPLVYF